MKIEGAAVILALAGSASIPARELDLKGTAALVAPPKPGAAPFELPFIVQGSWDDPTYEGAGVEGGTARPCCPQLLLFRQRHLPGADGTVPLRPHHPEFAGQRLAVAGADAHQNPAWLTRGGEVADERVSSRKNLIRFAADPST